MNPDVQDAITSGIATVAGVPQEQTEAALQVISGVAKLARSYMNPDGTLSVIPPNQRRIGPSGYRWSDSPAEDSGRDESGWLPWARSFWGSSKPSGGHGGHSHGGHGHGHQGSHSVDAHFGGGHGGGGSHHGDAHAGIGTSHAVSGLAGVATQHAGGTQAGHSHENKGVATHEQHIGWAKKGGVDMGFDYGIHFNKNKESAASHSNESAWGCADQAAALYRKWTAFDVCSVFDFSKRGAASTEHGHGSGFEHDAHAQHHWDVNHGHGH